MRPGKGLEDHFGPPLGQSKAFEDHFMTVSKVVSCMKGMWDWKTMKINQGFHINNRESSRDGVLLVYFQILKSILWHGLQSNDSCRRAFICLCGFEKPLCSRKIICRIWLSISAHRKTFFKILISGTLYISMFVHLNPSLYKMGYTGVLAVGISLWKWVNVSRAVKEVPYVMSEALGQLAHLRSLIRTVAVCTMNLRFPNCTKNKRLL